MSNSKVTGQGLAYDDVLLIPGYSEVLPREVDLRTRLTREIELNTPIVSAAMDTITEIDMAIALAREGGIGILHKNLSIERQTEMVEQVKRSLNAALEIHGVVLTMYDARNNLANQVVADVRGFLGDKVYDTVIPRNVRVSEAPSHGKPVLLYDLKCPGSQAYLKLASEVIRRERHLTAA